ncbi:hypothetical protein [Streptomyces sp. WM6378]|uniref:hypothetical protein n=1 Tax=Streptomyces sp. WM6378 TaxID=1415557 RepID=UPI000A6C5FF2|nr:hypothetical protein [Streptomyces sp. WM6378]
MRDRDDEPVFRKGGFGTNRYEYNPANPMGRVLIVVTVIGVIVGLVVMGSSH